jgi:integrase
MSAILTVLQIENLKPGSRRREVSIGRPPELYLVIQPSGSRSWALRYRFHGRPTKLTLGGYPEVDLAQGRRLAQKALGAIADGKDPAEAKRTERAAKKAEAAAEADLVENVAADYIRLHAMRKTRDWKETARILNKNVIPTWKGRALADIQRKDVARLLDQIIERGAPIAANRVFSLFRGLCGWAIERGIIERNPCTGMRPPSPETPRERVLTDAELSLVWRAAGETGFPWGPLVQMLALTGQRLREVGGLTWREIDAGRALWILPSARAKNRKEHTVPLSPAVLALISDLPRFKGSPYLLGATAAPKGFAKAKVRLDTAIARINGDEPIPPWRFHDIRRSVATNLQKLGVRLEVTEAVLGHVGGSRAGVVGIYQRHDWAAEKRDALTAWARALDAIVTGETASNVLELAGARG